MRLKGGKISAQTTLDLRTSSICIIKWNLLGVFP